MRRLERFKILQLFADGKSHNWFENIFLGVKYLKVHQDEFESLFKRALENGIVCRTYDRAHWKDDNYKITTIGEECFRAEQIMRGGDYNFYKHYDRSVSGTYGVDHFAPLPKSLTPMDA